MLSDFFRPAVPNFFLEVRPAVPKKFCQKYPYFGPFFDKIFWHIRRFLEPKKDSFGRANYSKFK